MVSSTTSIAAVQSSDRLQDDRSASAICCSIDLRGKIKHDNEKQKNMTKNSRKRQWTRELKVLSFCEAKLGKDEIACLRWNEQGTGCCVVCCLLVMAIPMASMLSSVVAVVMMFSVLLLLPLSLSFLANGDGGAINASALLAHFLAVTNALAQLLPTSPVC